MRDVAITVTPSTEKLEITSGRLVYLDQHAITVTNGDGDNFDADRAYRLTVKRKGRYSGDAITYASHSTIDGDELTFVLNLNVAALGTLLDAADQGSVDVCIDITDGTDTTYGIEDAIPVYNRVRRPGDTEADNPSTNSYTDDEIDAMLAGGSIPAASGEDTDGTIAQVLSGVWAKVTRDSWLRPYRSSGATLPTGGDIVTGQIFELTAADGTALAAPGWYVHDGDGWLCLAYTDAYALGDLGATPSHTLIAGVSYTATVDQEVTSWTLTLSRPGMVALTLANAGGAAVAQPTMSGRTAKLLKSTGWDDVTEALSRAVVEDDGTYLIAAAGGLS